jgi:alanyl-tRNA synthetase
MYRHPENVSARRESGSPSAIGHTLISAAERLSGMASGTDAAAEPETLAFESTVRAIEGRRVRLERTYFYPESGGQPADEGTLSGIDVVDVQRNADGIEHVLAGDPSLAVGDRVAGEIDEAVRTYHRRAHTASHIVYGAGRRLIDASGYGGFDIGPERIRLDFETDATVEDVDPLAFQRLANEVVWEDRAVTWGDMDVEAARADADIVFNVDDAAAATGAVRIVEVDGWDVSACGGTHVRSTAEIGYVSVLECSNPGSGLLRIEYAVGPPAIERQLAETEAAAAAADRLDTGIEGLPARAEALQAERDSLRATVSALTDRLLAARLDALADRTVEHDGREWLVGTVDSVDANAVADFLRGADRGADVVVLVGGDDTTFVVVAGGDPAPPAVVEAITARFGGGGGGGPSLAQGGGVDADPEDVVEALRTGDLEW